LWSAGGGIRQWGRGKRRSRVGGGRRRLGGRWIVRHREKALLALVGWYVGEKTGCC